MAARGSTIPYPTRDLFDTSPPDWLSGRQLDEVAFPLGGLGTGCISLSGWGHLVDWEIRNRPAKGFAVPWAFAMLRCRGDGLDVTRVLEGPPGGRYAVGGHSLGHEGGQGLPRFRQVRFRGTFPLAQVELRDPDVPVDVELEAFNPFIPLNDRDSGLPAAILIYRLRNRSRQPLRLTLFASLTNIIGDPKQHTRQNRRRAGKGACGLLLDTAESPADDPSLGSLAVASLGEVAVLPRWFHAHGHRRINHFWSACAEAPSFPPRRPKGLEPASDTGTIAVELELPAGGSAEVPVIIAWHQPVFTHWHTPEGGTPASWTNWYATQSKDAWDVVGYVAEHLPRLHRETTAFRDALFASTVPRVVLDAVSSQISILKSPTVLRLTDGTFYGFEGCSDQGGCCEGSCTHVWNYAQALPYLFPGLQRSMREADWANSLLDDGYVTFRMPLPLGTRARPDFHPAADGQLGTVAQVWREYLVCGDRDWLQRIWPNCRRALEFAWLYWDRDRDGVPEGMQHNTYDQEFWGPNTMIGSLYLAALRAGEEIARELGDSAAAEQYRALFERGSAWTDANLFNGEYYEQKVNPTAHEVWPETQLKLAVAHGKDSRFTDQPAWQYGRGCLSDQLIGQWYAEMLGLGKLYQPKHIRTALQAIFRHNWQPDLAGHACTLRVYATAGEAGLLICTWPRGERPGDPFWFADEVWCGIEYQVACHLIWEGFVAEGLAIVKGLRDRYTGERRNPWDEIECGHHYVRSMASYNLLAALAGLRYRADSATLELRPKLNAEQFTTFVSVAAGWGTVSQTVTGDTRTVTVTAHHGTLPVQTLILDGKAGSVTARVGRKSVPAMVESSRAGCLVRFDAPAVAEGGAKVVVTLGG